MVPPGGPALDTSACPLDCEPAVATPASSHPDESGRPDGDPAAYTLFFPDRQPDELLEWFKSMFEGCSGARLEFPPSLSKAERAAWHRPALRKGLVTCSQGVGHARFLTIASAAAAGDDLGSEGASRSLPVLTREQRDEARMIYDAGEIHVCERGNQCYWLQ